LIASTISVATRSTATFLKSNGPAEPWLAWKIDLLTGKYRTGRVYCCQNSPYWSQ
jgi:hypothetical protein